MNRLSPLSLLQKHFGANDQALRTVYQHSLAVARKAVAIARTQPRPGIDLAFVEEAALLHDIGVCLVHAPDLNCFGPAPYIRHGIIGREILEAEGLPRHAMVCERHIGVGLTVQDIEIQKLPLPPREMAPVSDEEQIVALADLFFSKRRGELSREKSIAEVRRSLGKFGAQKVAIFNQWIDTYRLLPGS